MTPTLLSLLAWMVAAAPAEAAPCPGWRYSGSGGNLVFEARYEGASAAGEFSRFEVCIDIDPNNPGAGSLNVEIDIGSADMRSADINEEIMQPAWFGAGMFPTARFASDDLRATGPAAFEAHGELTLKGITRPVDVPFTWEDSDGGARIAGQLTLNRTEFEIGSGEWSGDGPIGHAVAVRFSVPLDPSP